MCIRPPQYVLQYILDLNLIGVSILSVGSMATYLLLRLQLRQAASIAAGRLDLAPQKGIQRACASVCNILRPKQLEESCTG